MGVSSPGTSGGSHRTDIVVDVVELVVSSDCTADGYTNISGENCLISLHFAIWFYCWGCCGSLRSPGRQHQATFYPWAPYVYVDVKTSIPWTETHGVHVVWNCSPGSREIHSTLHSPCNKSGCMFCVTRWELIVIHFFINLS